jgi:RNA polymerase subunit RPABC4/transcription elongation factor Spt4
MDKVFTKKLKRTSACKNCKAEIPKHAMVCPVCGAKNSYPEILAALIIGGMVIVALYVLYHLY